ncbi:MAG: enoyl-CoA hydratase-related protein [Actinomycetota bacterium]|nr:enoyl-CoA hydratase-related protein [Actinomycetota bacterium]
MSFVSIDDRGPVRWVTMSSPGAKNAIPKSGWAELAEAFEGFEASDQRAMVVIGADGDFSAGADLSADFSGFGTAVANADYMRLPNRAAMALHRISKPTIAAVDGVAVGAGMNLALGCDMVIATDLARFSEIFVKRGLTLDFGGTWLLPRLVGLARAREIALTGRIVAAEEALLIGLVTRVVDVAGLEETVTEIAEGLAAGAPLAQRFIKAALDRSSTMTFEQSLAYEEQAQSVLLGSEDLFEGAASFFQKRPPEFKGR